MCGGVWGAWKAGRGARLLLRDPYRAEAMANICVQERKRS